MCQIQDLRETKSDIQNLRNDTEIDFVLIKKNTDGTYKI